MAFTRHGVAVENVLLMIKTTFHIIIRAPDASVHWIPNVRANQPRNGSPDRKSTSFHGCQSPDGNPVQNLSDYWLQLVLQRIKNSSCAFCVRCNECFFKKNLKLHFRRNPLKLTGCKCTTMSANAPFLLVRKRAEMLSVISTLLFKFALFCLEIKT